ncbi:MAG: pyridoxamine 5'-phosphate oxidase [Chloroflexi bacterium]|nr:pyridoxamine 5'-phosphate oxidase [Chloroflexota bacterium]MDL1941921.1 pyridoxamine 5'-phosphate oxidase family protein [Chloroflexi bacterium CFX2]
MPKSIRPKLPRVTRPKLPGGYADHPTSQVSWKYVEERLTASKQYWMCSVRPNGRPHVVPRWGVYLDGKIYYDGSPDTVHARNILKNPSVTVHLEDGWKAVILEGASAPAPKPSRALAQRLVKAYRKYAEDGYNPDPHQWDGGGLYVFTPRKCLAWTVLFEDPTKFVFDAEEE